MPNLNHIYFLPPAFLQVLSHTAGIEPATFTYRDSEVASQLLPVTSLLSYRGALKYNSMNGVYLSCINTFTALHNISEYSNLNCIGYVQKFIIDNICFNAFMFFYAFNSMYICTYM